MVFRRLSSREIIIVGVLVLVQILKVLMRQAR